VAQRVRVSPDSLDSKVERTYGGESDGRDLGCTGGCDERATQLR
jgi:hypothetical protein